MLYAWDAVSPLDRMFDDVMGSTLGTATNSRSFEPTIDIRFTDKEVCLVCDVPGVKEEELEITVENRVLTIRGARKFEAAEGEQVVLGRPYGAFTRTYTLPPFLDEAQLSADLRDGVLTIRLPKHPHAQPRKIPIRGASPPQLKE